MKDAATTWAVVIGIDEYDNLPKLQGAAHDAADAITWLRTLGVPAGQIFAHLTPSAANSAAVEALKIRIRGCKTADIETSFLRLMENAGSRLFVFLCGHGFYEPGGERLFLTREANLGRVTNLSVDWYAKLLRGLDYKRQFIVMDGCMNLPYAGSQRRLISGGTINAVEPQPAREDVFQVFCYAASQGETAKEFDGRGAFMKPLLNAFNLSMNTREAWSIDESTGNFILDLAETVENVVSPAVTDANKAQGRIQHPGYQVLSHGGISDVIPVAVVPPAATANVSVNFGPSSALSEQARIDISMNRTGWRWVRPTNRQPLTTRGTFRVPTGVLLYASSFAGTAWRPVALEVPVDHADLTLSLTHSEAGPPPVIEEGRHGGWRGGGGGGDTASVGNEWVDFDYQDGWDRDHTKAVPKTAAVIELPLTEQEAVSLAGVHAIEEVISIGQVSIAPLTLTHEKRVEVSPGPILIKVTLPWGTWTQSVLLSPGRSKVVYLPRTIGAPPLRTRLLNDYTFRANSSGLLPRSIVGLRPEQALDIVDEDGVQMQGLTQAAPGTAELWKGAIFRFPSSDIKPWSLYASIHRQAKRVIVPLNDLGPLGVSLKPLRAEPLSVTRAKGWDSIVASGDLRDISPQQADELTYMKWDEPLLGVAASYALLAAKNINTLGIVLGNMTLLGSPMADQVAGLPDIEILQAIRCDAVPDGASVRQCLARLAITARPPVFRWGLAIGIGLAKRYGHEQLAERYEHIERRLVPGSVWTMWRQ